MSNPAKMSPPRPFASTLSLALAACIQFGAGGAWAADAKPWISTWAASPHARYAPGFVVPDGLFGLPGELSNQTVRQVVRTSIGGNRVRIRISNEFGSAPLVIGGAHIALAGKESSITAGSDKPLTFAGQASVTIPPGAPMLSDPVDFELKPLASVAVSLYFPRTTDVDTYHWDGVQTAYISDSGDFLGAAEIKAKTTAKSRMFLADVEVEAGPDTKAVVFFGDSITDGNCSTPDANQRWPDLVAERMQAGGAGHIAVVNEAISGARVLSDGMGASAVARFDRDVLRHAGVTTMVLMMGINDIGWAGTGLAPHDQEPTKDAIIAGYQQLIDRARARGIRVVAATLTPFADAFKGGPFPDYYSPDKDKIRQAVNEWIRTGGAFDGVIDFDAATRDPDKPDHIRAAYDCGDHLHPNDAGYKAMADSVDLKVLTGAAN